MAQDALQVGESRAAGVVGRALDNLSLVQNFMGLLGRTVYMANKLGKDVYRVKIEKPYFIQTLADGNQIRAKITFDGVGADHSTLNFMDRVDGMQEFIGRKSLAMAKVLERNPTYFAFLQECVRLMENHALHVGKPFADVDILRASITDEDVLIMVVI